MGQQWANTGAGFTPIGEETFPKLQPGYYRPDSTGGMQPQLVVVPLNLVTDELMILADFPVDHVVQSIKKFWAKEAQYKRNGLLHKRGLLLEGPPGTGKTSISNLIAKFFVENDGIVFFGGMNNVNNGTLQAAIAAFRQIQTTPLLVVLEEFDTLMKKTEWKDQLMQMMDGANQVNNVVYLLATNHIDQIDQRFTKRPSRIDEVLHVGLPSEITRRAYLEVMLKRYEGEAEDIEKWVAMTEGLLLAHLKEAVIAIKILDQPLEKTIERLKGMVPDAKAKKEKDKWAIAATMQTLSNAAFELAEAADPDGGSEDD